MMTGISGTSQNGKLHSYYSCKGVSQKKCGRKNVQKDYIENLVIAKARALLTDELIEKVANAVRAVTEPEENDDVYAAFDVLSACAQYSAAVLEPHSENLHDVVVFWDSMLDKQEKIGFGVVRLRYKLYRFVSAMETANGDAAFEQTWNKELVSQAFDDYYNTITKYTTQEV